MDTDFIKKKITLTLKNVTLNPRVKSRFIKDRNVSKIAVRRKQTTLEIVLHLRNPNSRIFHFSDKKKSQIVIDINGVNKPFLQTRVGKGEPRPEPRNVEPRNEVLLPRKERLSKTRRTSPSSRKARVSGMSQRKIRQINRQDIENKLKNG